jgi:ribosomal protein S1
MTRMPLNPGDVLDAVVTKSLPFGALVETTAGVPGLVHGAASDVGTTVRVEVVGYDDVEKRFSARLG